jgi:hypothetical protein
MAGSLILIAETGWIFFAVETRKSRLNAFQCIQL